MKFLIRLYPRAWRARYGTGFEALLQQERPGIAATINIVAAALLLRLQGGFVQSREAGFSAYRTFRLLPRGGRFSIGVALMSSMVDLGRSGSAIASLALFAGTLAVIALKLLHQTASERDGHRARVVLLLILFVALPLHLLVPSTGHFSVGGATRFQPSLMGLILAIGSREQAWPKHHRLRVIGATIWASGLQSLALLTATAFGLLRPGWGFAFTSFAWLVTLFFVGERRKLLTPSVPVAPVDRHQ